MSHLYIVCELLLFHLLFNARDVRNKEQKKERATYRFRSYAHSLSKQYMRLVDSHNCDFNFDLKL